MKQPLITIFIIATNGYHKFAIDLIGDLLPAIADNDVDVIVLTDSVQGVEDVFPAQSSLRCFEIPNLRWPEATILRFKYISKHINEAKAKTVCYLDADMRVADLPQFLRGVSDIEPMLYVVQHPGYSGYRRLLLLKGLIGFGPFETRRRSRAFVSLPNRLRRYNCGAIWFGPLDIINELVSVLEECVSEDYSNGIEARFHDESHLNRYRIDTKEFRFLGDEWAHWGQRRRRTKARAILTLVEKESSWVQNRSG